MSLIGREWAVLSVGMACQTSRQIRADVDLLRAHTGDVSLAPSTFLFDWLICPPESAARMLGDGAFYPRSPDDLSINYSVWWKEYNAYFWHDFPDNEVDAGFEEKRQRYAYIASKLDQVRAARKILIVFSNTQNNLAFVSAATGTVARDTTVEDLLRLKSAAEGYFQRDTTMLAVTHTPLSGEASPGLFFETVEGDDTAWEGSTPQWGGAFERFFQATRG